MFVDLSLSSDQISGQNKKSLLTFVSGMKESHLSVGQCGQRPAPLHMRPIYPIQQQISLNQTQNTKGTICSANIATGYHWLFSFYSSQCVLFIISRSNLIMFLENQCVLVNSIPTPIELLRYYQNIYFIFSYKVLQLYRHRDGTVQVSSCLKTLLQKWMRLLDEKWNVFG